MLLTQEMITALTATLAYCLCSMTMIYANKYILSVFDFDQAGVLLIVQVALTRSR